MKPIHVIVLVLFVVYLVYTVRVSRQIFNSAGLTLLQKRFHVIMVWLIPFLWFLMFKPAIIHNLEVMTKKKRDELKRKKSGGFYESGRGVSG